MSIKDKTKGMVSGFQIRLVKYKFLWFTFHSRYTIRIFPGYFIKNNKKIILENMIKKSIYKPGLNTWYHVYLYYHDKVIDIIFHDKVGNYENYKRICSIFVNRKRRIQPFIQYRNEFLWVKPPVQKIKNLTVPHEIKVIKKTLKEILSQQDKIIEKLQEEKNEYILKIDGKFITVDDAGWPVLDEELCGRTTRFTKASGEEYKNNLMKNKLFGKYELVLIPEIIKKG